MKEFSIYLNDVSKIKEFNTRISAIDCDADLVSGKYVVDAKSIMGTFSLNLTKCITLRINSDDPEVIKKVSEIAKDFAQ